ARQHADRDDEGRRCFLWDVGQPIFDPLTTRQNPDGTWSHDPFPPAWFCTSILPTKTRRWTHSASTMSNSGDLATTKGTSCISISKIRMATCWNSGAESNSDLELMPLRAVWLLTGLTIYAS